MGEFAQEEEKVQQQNVQVEGPVNREEFEKLCIIMELSDESASS